MDNVNTIGDFLRSTFSKMVNRDGKVFKALIANAEETGTIEQIFNNMEAVREELCNNPDFYNQNGEILEKTMSFFSFLERLFEESDDSLKRRNELLFYRGGDTIWGDYWNILKIFKLFFGTEFVYIVNNTNPIQENLLLDGDFEIQNGSWELNGCSYDAEARFSERTGVKFEGLGMCQQTVNVNQNTTYFLHFFLKGKIAVKIKDNNGRYWNSNAGEMGCWVTVEKTNEFSTETWNAKSIYILTDESVSSVNICFFGLKNEFTYLDYVRLFLKEIYSTFTLIALFGGFNTVESLNMAPGTIDPVENENGITVNYNIMSYIEQAYLFGVEGGLERFRDIYTELLNMVGAGGITSYIEILTRDLDLQEVHYA